MFEFLYQKKKQVPVSNDLAKLLEDIGEKTVYVAGLIKIGVQRYRVGVYGTLTKGIFRKADYFKIKGIYEFESQDPTIDLFGIMKETKKKTGLEILFFSRELLAKTTGCLETGRESPFDPNCNDGAQTAFKILDNLYEAQKTF